VLPFQKFAALATVVLLTASLHIIQTPPDLPPPVPDDLRPSPTASSSCAEIASYQTDLFGVFGDHEVFMEAWTDTPEREIRRLGHDEFVEIIDDGELLLEDLGAVTAPEVYAEGHEGIIARLAFEVDYFVFVGIDSSTAPSLGAVQDSLQQIYNGEVAAAEACPDEIEEAGGFIFIDPETLADVVEEP
jgi:hypothetical protein